MMIRKFAAVALLGAVLTGCGAHGYGNKQAGGTLVGAGLGALAGSQIGGGRGQLAAVAIGTLAGAFLGNQVGQSLDRADRLYAERAASQSLEYTRTGHTTTWSNPDSGNSGTFTPSTTYQTPSGEYCREYQTTVIVGGEEQRAFGRACRQPDGSWKVV